jgi:hypothetical protein
VIATLTLSLLSLFSFLSLSAPVLATDELNTVKRALYYERKKRSAAEKRLKRLQRATGTDRRRSPDSRAGRG